VDDQTAKEVKWDSTEGAFTRLIRRLIQQNPDASLYDMLMKINNDLQKMVSNQSIQLSTNVDLTVNELKQRKFYNTTNFTLKPKPNKLEPVKLEPEKLKPDKPGPTTMKPIQPASNKPELIEHS
jgi:hypothetical protein